MIGVEDVLHFRGDPILVGCFGVRRPGKLTASVNGVLQLTMDVQVTNSRLLEFDGDMHRLPVSRSILQTVIFPHKVTLFDAVDFAVSIFELFMPAAWHWYFVFRQPVAGFAVRLPDLAECYLAAIVLPMCFKFSTGIMQSV